MLRNKQIFVELTKLSKMSLSTPDMHVRVIDIAFLAFYNKKPLFINKQKPAAAKLIEKSLPLIDMGFRLNRRGMNPDLRQNAQISRSGLQYLIDDFKDNEEIYQKLKPIFNLPGVKGIEKEIQAYTGIPPEYGDLREMDMSKIPPSHFWWFFVDDDVDEE